jgi:hypothetical protein
MERVIIGYSDYSRQQIEKGNIWILGDSRECILDTIAAFEHEDYNVKFETSLFRKIFCLAKYKVVAYKNYNNGNKKV